MNRQEIIEQIKLIQAGLTQDDNNKSKRRLDLVIEELEKPMSLADFLGWEEDVIYVDKDNIPHRINKNGLLTLENNEWKHNHQYTFNNYCISLLRNFKEAKNTIFKLHYLKYKGFKNAYVNFNISKNEVSFGDELNCEHYQTQFTLQEIEKISMIFDINLSNFEIVEVQE